jgi:prepilin-type processing-associated H-X9-DG protein
MCINYGISMAVLSNLDGSSNTIMLNEVRIGTWEATDPRGTWALGMPGASVTCGGWTWDCTNPNDKNDSSDDCEGCNSAGNNFKDGMGCWPGCPFQQATARSRHTGGVNAAFADGSVRFISNAVTQAVWWGLNCRDDAIGVSGAF